MADYSETTEAGIIIRNADGANIPADERNRDYQDYLIWVGEGGIPDPVE